jgi:hypothetical protein
MNIFILHHDVVQAAQEHCDAHVRKMVIEYAQQLCSVYWLNGKKAPYKLTHQNHYPQKWARQSFAHWIWLFGLWRSLLDEYEFRFGKKHKAARLLKWFQRNMPRQNWFERADFVFPDRKMIYVGNVRRFAKESITETYRRYYRRAKRNLMVFTRRETPIWL